MIFLIIQSFSCTTLEIVIFFLPVLNNNKHSSTREPDLQLSSWLSFDFSWFQSSSWFSLISHVHTCMVVKFTMYVYATESKPSDREFRNAAEGRWLSMEIVKARKIWGNEKHPKYSEKKREEKGTGSLLETRTLRGAARLKNEHPKWRWLMKSAIAALGPPAFLPYLSVSLFLVLLSARVLFPPILWCSQTGDHPQEDLAKFGHIPHVKVEKFKICLYFGYMMEPDVESWRLIFLFFLLWSLFQPSFYFSIFGNLAKLGPSFSQKILCKCWNRRGWTMQNLDNGWRFLQKQIWHPWKHFHKVLSCS